MNNIQFIRVGENIGFSAGNNIGIIKALKEQDCQFLWILNNDTIVKENTLTTMIEKMSTSDDIVVVGSVTLEYNYPEYVQNGGGKIKYLPFGSNSIIRENTKEKELAFYDEDTFEIYNGASFLMRADFFRDNHLVMDDRLFLYYEEIAMVMQLRRYGKRVAVALKSHVYHKGGASTCKTNNLFLLYHLWRSKYIILGDYFKFLLPTEFLIDMSRVLFNLCKFDFKKARTYLDAIWTGLSIGLRNGAK